MSPGESPALAEPPVMATVGGLSYPEPPFTSSMRRIPFCTTAAYAMAAVPDAGGAMTISGAWPTSKPLPPSTISMPTTFPSFTTACNAASPLAKVTAGGALVSYPDPMDLTFTAAITPSPRIAFATAPLASDCTGAATATVGASA